MFQSLTVGQDFHSKTAKMQAERARRLEEQKEVYFTVYEGKVPLHQRLVLLVQDFLESTVDFELSDLFNF